MMTAYLVRRLESRDDMNAVVETTYEAHSQPYFTGAQMLFPIFGYSLEDRVKSIIVTQQRLWSDHIQGDGSKRWYVVEDSNTHKVVAGVAWQYFKSSPFPDGKPKLDFHWWPPGDAKDYCEEVFQQMSVPRCLWMNRTHGEITNMVVHPDHRNRGVGKLMMDAINKDLDEISVEGFTEATELGRILYEKAGFQVLMKLDFFIPPGKPASWNRLEHDLKMPPLYAMWRPTEGRIVQGKDKPWLLM